MKTLNINIKFNSSKLWNKIRFLKGLNRNQTKHPLQFKEQYIRKFHIQN